jgi:hypothetical protein
MRDILILLVLLLLLPVILIFIGPAMVLAALRGHQWLGPITLDSTQYNFAGRAGMFLLGIALWLLIWSGLFWLVLTGLPAQLLLTETTTNPLVVTVQPTSLPPQPTETPPAETATLIPTFTPTATPANTATPIETPTPDQPLEAATSIVPEITATPAATSTPTATPAATDTPEPSATPAESPTPRPAISTASEGGVRLSLADRRAVIISINTANELLRDAVASGSEDSLNELESIWQGKALTVIRRFASSIQERYTQPVEVNFEYLALPQISPDSNANEVEVTTVERWNYGSPSSAKGRNEALEFIYTLIPGDNNWVITRYTYRNLPGGAVATATATATVTSPGPPPATMEN